MSPVLSCYIATISTLFTSLAARLDVGVDCRSFVNDVTANDWYVFIQQHCWLLLMPHIYQVGSVTSSHTAGPSYMPSPRSPLWIMPHWV